MGFAAASVGLATLTWLLTPYAASANALPNITLIYLLAVLVAAAAWGYVVGLSTAVAADLLVNFFFVAPIHTFTVAAPHNVLALLLFLAVAAIGASMLSLLRRQARLAEMRRAETNLMLELSQAAAAANTPGDALQVVAEQICRAFDARSCRILAMQDGAWRAAAAAGDTTAAQVSRDEASMAEEALRSLDTVGRGSRMWGHLRRSGRDTHELFAPFPEGAPERGVLHLLEPHDTRASADSMRLITSYAAEASVALHRVRLASEAERAEAFRRSDELKTLLLTSLSHDLRSPLTAVKAAVSNLRDDSIAWDQADVDGFLETIEEQTDRLTATVNDLLQLSRLESGAVEPRTESVQVALLLGDAAQSMASATVGRTVAVEADSNVWVAGDYRLLSQALANLIENAARYSVEGGRIVLVCSAIGSTIWLTVRDEGPAIPEAERPRLFDRFFRGSNGQLTRGTGLGLSIVAAIAALGGGSVLARAYGNGNEIGFSVPAAEAPA